jgi:NADH:ubiquinone oxidoreductase subunit E
MKKCVHQIKSNLLEEESPMCKCNGNGPASDLSLLEGVLAEYGDTTSNLITILQKAQDIYGYLPKDVLYHVADRLGTTPRRFSVWRHSILSSV